MSYEDRGVIKMKMTISEIAKLSEVSKSTVSRYLNNGYVSPDAKAKIEKVIQETGYKPNAFAQNLKSKTSNFIGVIIPRLDSYAVTKTLMGIDSKLKENNFQMLVASTNQNIEREIESLYSLSTQKVAGIIFLGTEITKKHEETIEKLNIPVIIVGQEHYKFNCIIHDDFNAAYELSKKVLSMGHKHITYLGVTEKDVAVGIKRKDGFRKAIEEAEDVKVNYYTTSFSMDDAINIGNTIIKKENSSLLFCATDNIALGVMKSIFSNGLKVPTDFSVVGFGGYKIAEIFHPSLTTIKFDYYGAGNAAGINIIKLIKGEKINRLTISNYELLNRESVDSLI